MAAMRILKGKGKIVPKHHAMEIYAECGGIAPRILRPWHEMHVSGQLHAPAALSCVR
jgi:hypothetical protein